MIEKLSTAIVDMYDEPRKETLDKLSAVFPDFVKNTHRMSGDELSALSDSDFAVVVVGRSGSVIRKWPLTCPGHTWMAAAFWGANGENCPEAMRMVAAHYILEAARKWGVYKDLPFRKDLESATPSSLPESNCINLVRSGMRISEMDRQSHKTRPSRGYMAYGLKSKNRYPIGSKSLLKRAMDYFVEHESRIQPDDKFEFAGNMMKQAGEFEVDVPDSIKKYATLGYNSSTVGHILRRIDFMGSAQSKLNGESGTGVLKKLASMAEEESVPAKQIFKVLCAFDKKAGLDEYYGRIADPSQAFAGGDPKLQKEGSYLGEVDGRTFTSMDLKKALEKKADMVHAFGKETVAMLEKEGQGASVFSTLPLPYKRYIASLVS